jgi:hypothetical protein
LLAGLVAGGVPFDRSRISAQRNPQLRPATFSSLRKRQVGIDAWLGTQLELDRRPGQNVISSSG